MLIINADDLGKNRLSTNNILDCYRNNRLKSASAMVFMEDSERAAEMSRDSGMDIGLHLNFSEKFNGKNKNQKLAKYQSQIVNYLKTNKYFQLLYNPWLRNCFIYVYQHQLEEYLNLYKNEPTHIDGHQHMHLCANMIIGGLMPIGKKVRRNFTFTKKEKNIVNRLYRNIVDMWLNKKYCCTDFFFSIYPFDNEQRINDIIKLSKKSNVELMVHPEVEDEYEYILSPEFQSRIERVHVGTFSDF